MSRRRQTILFLTLLLVSCSGLADRVDRQRERFLAAESALRNGQQPEFQEIRQTLTAYPLLGYLDFWELQGRLGTAPPRDVDAFLRHYAGQSVATRLRSSWLHVLGKRKDWDNFLAFYVPQSSVSLQCYDIRARLQKGARDLALKDALALWLVGHSQPDACDPAFDQLYATGAITSALLWKRIRLAFNEQKPSLAGYLARRLSAEDRTWVQRWQQAHRRPTRAINQPWAKADTPLVRDILTHALQRLARHKPSQAWKHWQALSATHEFSDTQRGAVLARIALSGAVSGDPEAADWLAQVPPSATDASIRQWRVRVALFNGDWKNALRWLDALTPDERQEDHWRYWRARALAASGMADDAYAGYLQLSTERSYFGFLAADQVQRPYSMNNARTEAATDELSQIEQLPGVQRAHELYLLGKRLDARREWFQATRNMPAAQLRLAAELAHRWGWHDRAILAASRARYWSDLTLRFPLPHRESIFANARHYGLDPALIYGVIRQESIFMEDAVSPAGALGLMQLMPATGKQTAQKLNIRYGSSQALLQSERNIQLGSAYLDSLMTRYNGSPVLAAAAYNAGPSRVARWLPEDTDMDATLWTEHIPFRETRAYVRRVLTYATIFDWRLERDEIRLSERLPTVRRRN